MTRLFKLFLVALLVWLVAWLVVGFTIRPAFSDSAEFRQWRKEEEARHDRYVERQERRQAERDRQYRDYLRGREERRLEREGARKEGE